MLLGSNLESAYGRGPLMMYNWPGNFFEVLGNGTFGLGTYTSHDLQYVSSHMYDMHLKDYFNDSSVDTHVGGGRDRVFRPSTTLNLIFAEDIVTGDLQRTIGPFDHAAHERHEPLPDPRERPRRRQQPLERLVALYDMTMTLWTCGGVLRQLHRTIDLDGTVISVGRRRYHAAQPTPDFLEAPPAQPRVLRRERVVHVRQLVQPEGRRVVSSTTSRFVKVVLDGGEADREHHWAFGWE